MNQEKPKVLLVNSGGLDSLVVARILYNQGYRLYSCHFDFNTENTDRAKESAKRIADNYCELGHEVITLSSNMRDTFGSISRKKETSFKYIPSVPYGGTVCAILSSTIAVINDIDYVASGHKNDVGHDPKQWSHAMTTLIAGQTMREPVVLLKPLSAYRNVKDTTERGLQEGLTLEEMSFTTSCVLEEPCGECGKCKGRIESNLKPN